MLWTLHWWNGPTSIWQIFWTPSFRKELNDVDKPVVRHFNIANHSISDIKVSAISSISVIAVKYREKESFSKLEPSIRTGWKNDFLLFDPFIVSVLVQHVRTKAVTSHFYFCNLLCIIMHLLLFVSRWLAYFLSHGYLSYINSLGFLFIFCFISE